MTDNTSRSILDELDTLLNKKDIANIIESRSTHVIQSAVNLINLIKTTYPDDVANELERRLINAIKTQDSSKFTRGIRKIKNESK